MLIPPSHSDRLREHFVIFVFKCKFRDIVILFEVLQPMVYVFDLIAMHNWGSRLPCCGWSRLHRHPLSWSLARGALMSVQLCKQTADYVLEHKLIHVISKGCAELLVCWIAVSSAAGVLSCCVISSRCVEFLFRIQTDSCDWSH